MKAAVVHSRIPGFQVEQIAYAIASAVEERTAVESHPGILTAAMAVELESTIRMIAVLVVVAAVELAEVLVVVERNVAEVV